MIAFAGASAAQVNRIDIVRPDAPELAEFGEQAIGVRTIEVSDPERPDVLGTEQGQDTAVYDRRLTLEIWYPATLERGQEAGVEYHAITREPSITATLRGRAVRDAEPDRPEAAYPLVIISHGYPGNRYLLSHMGENLASKGYVVVSIDHTDSTYDDQQAFASTLYNRSRDQQFVLDEIGRLAAAGSGHFLEALADADNSALVGYSMGGYGAVNNLGAGYSDAAVDFAGAPPNRLLHERAASNPDFRASIDSRIKAGVAIAPWGMNMGFWEAEGLAGLDKPTLFVAGDADGVAGYENGVRAIYQGAVNSDRYLLTFENAGHNAGAPIPLPVEVLQHPGSPGASHYIDAVWDNVRMNNILDHFATAFLDWHLKGQKEKQTYLDLVPRAEEGVFAVDSQGRQTSEHTYWKGFSRESAIGLILEHAEPRSRD